MMVEAGEDARGIEILHIKTSLPSFLKSASHSSIPSILSFRSTPSRVLFPPFQILASLSVLRVLPTRASSLAALARFWSRASGWEVVDCAGWEWE